MSTIVLQLPLATIQQLQAKYTAYQQKTPPHAHFQIKLPQLVVTAYLSGKVVLQGNAINTFLTDNQLTPADFATSSGKSTKTTPTSKLPDNFDTWSVIGSDEVGTGSYFGPLTVACTYVAAEQIEILKQLGVKDSKNMSDAQIQALVPKIKELVPYKLLTLWPQKYNEVQRYKNLNETKAMMHNQALNLLQQQLAPLTPQAILIDEFCSPKTYFRYLHGQPTLNKENTYFITKGESHHIAVAAASMIARDAFLSGLVQLSYESGYTIPSGAGAAVDQLAATILKNDGPDALRKLAKLHFVNTKKAYKLAGLPEPR